MANSFEDLFSQGPSLAESTRAFLRLKTGSDDGLSMPAGGPDESGSQEGIFAAPLDQVVQLMAQMVQNEFKTMYAYTVYAQSLRGPEHFSIAREFEEHAGNELEHAEFLLRRMAVLGGGPVTVPNVPPPPPSSDPVEIIQTMIEMEQAGIQNWRTLLTTLGDNPTKHMVENFLTRELEHVDELWQMLPAEMQEGSAAGASAPAQAAVAPAAPPAASSMEQPPGGAPAGGGMGQQEAAKLGEKLASSHIQIRKEKAWGDPAKGGAAEIMDDFIKRASLSPEAQRMLQDTLKGGKKLDALKDQAGGLIGAAIGVPGHAAETSIKNSVEHLKKTASTEDPIAKAKEKAQASVAARNVHTQGQRGELYGDLVGRVLGAGGGWKAGKTLSGHGGPLATVAAAGLGSMLGSHAGKQMGREMDAKTAAVFQLLKKIAFDDRLNMLPQEQAAEQAQMQNESQFYSQKAQEHAAARQQLESSLQEATQKAQEQEQAISEMQSTMAANSQAASSATTQALLQAVNANTESIKQRQLASSTAQGLASLKDQLRQLAGDPGTPDTSGGAPGGAPTGAAAGQPSDGNPQGQGNPAGGTFGPAGAAPESQESASTVAPGGEESGHAPTAINEGSPNNMPKTQAGLIDTPQGKMGSRDLISLAASWGEKVGSLGQQLKMVGQKMAPTAMGAAAGGMATGGAALAKAQHSPEVEAERAQALDAENKPGYMGALGRAKAHSAQAFQEVLHEHPIAGAAAAAIPGAIMGGRYLPGAVNSIKKTVGNVKELRKVEG